MRVWGEGFGIGDTDVTERNTKVSYVGVCRGAEPYAGSLRESFRKHFYFFFSPWLAMVYCPLSS